MMTDRDDDPYSADEAPAEDMETRIRDALRSNSATSRFADYLAINTSGTTVEVRGVVEDPVDSEHVAEVIREVDGVHEVLDQLEVESPEE
jgi:osmotically-inducible protein OsmY